MTPFLSVENLNVSLSGKQLLEGVGFTIERGECTVIIGPNGAGKTTLLKAILGIVPRSGRLRLAGEDLEKLSRRAAARRIAYMQQLTLTHFAFTVRQIVEMGRYPHLGALAPATGEDFDAVEKAMNDLGVAGFADRQLEGLSGGERQMVLLAAALAQEPELLLLDEPTTFLDYRHQRDIAGRLEQLHHERGTTLLEVTHDVNRALRTADHIIALKNGRVVFDGTAEDLLQERILKGIYDVDFEWLEHPVSGRVSLHMS